MSLANSHIVAKPRLLFRPDAILGWKLTPGYAVRVAYRPQVIQQIDADGWRQIPFAKPDTGPRIAIYGCSFTYGTGLADHETFSALLQKGLPDLHILNRGIGGQGTVQNYLQFRSDLKHKAVDCAVFAIISDHRYRNIPHPVRMRQYLNPEWYRLGVEHVPVIQHDGLKQARLSYISIWQPLLARGGFDVFLPDQAMITEATLTALSMIQANADAANIPIAFVLLDALDKDFNRAVLQRFSRTTDISVPLDSEHTHLPHDRHPNARANQLYADRLMPIIQQLCSRFAGPQNTSTL